MRKDVRFHWEPDQDKAFVELKKRLMTAPILGMPTDDGAFIVDSDASTTGWEQSYPRCRMAMKSFWYTLLGHYQEPNGIMTLHEISSSMECYTDTEKAKIVDQALYS